MDERILVPLDGSKVGEAALPYVEDLVSKLKPEVKAEVILLQVLSPVEPSTVSGRQVPDIARSEKQMEANKKGAINYLDKAGEALRRKGATVVPRVGVGNAAEEIVKAAEEIKANVIAMSTHGRSGLGRWAFGSVTDKVLRREANIPIVVVRAPKGANKA